MYVIWTASSSHMQCTQMDTDGAPWGWMTNEVISGQTTYLPFWSRFYSRFYIKLQKANRENFISFSGNSIRLQTLPTGKCFSYLAFYKQKIRIFTSSINDTSRSSGHMFVSSEEDCSANISRNCFFSAEDCT